MTTPFPLPMDMAADLKVTIASMAGGVIPIDAGSKAEMFYTDDCKKFDADEVAQKQMKDSVKMSTIACSIGEYDALYLAGGHGTCKDFVENKELDKVISDAYYSKCIVAADCHGPVGICGAKKKNGEPLIKGLAVSGFADTEEKAVGLAEKVPFLLESKMKELGGKYEKKGDWQVCISCDTSEGTLVTGQNPASSKAVAEKVLELLKKA
mmetsp:Transcript_19934/g.48806  ORF Transcript_19934/g.48806 Transcript_19934/m.48806 type:complete len:209 (-) Transcript_19934:429-1055(-)